jgi:hypothetical protein
MFLANLKYELTIINLRDCYGDRTATAMDVREDIVMANMDAVLGCMNVLTTDYNNKTH